MISYQHPKLWDSPRWHADHGDPGIELEHLRAFALKLLSSVPSATISLEIPEPGLMDVRVELPRGLAAEIHSVPSLEDQGHRRLAVFGCPETANEFEVYAESVDDAANLFAVLSDGTGDDTEGGRDRESTGNGNGTREMGSGGATRAHHPPPP
jgi:hypothetical protein